MAIQIKWSFLFFIFISFNDFALAKYEGATTRVNVNQQTDLFEKSTGGFDDFKARLEEDKEGAKTKLMSKEHLDFITDKDEQGLISGTEYLQNMNPSELLSRGRAKMAEDNSMDQLYLDESLPLNKIHKEDAKDLAKGQEQLMGNLLSKLKELADVDCKTIKGPKVIEPTYYMQIEQRKHKDTKYNQTICEELRNSYRCTDSLSLTCLKRGMKWEAWQNKTFRISGTDFYNHARHLGYSIKWKKKRHGWHIHHNAVQWQEFITKHLRLKDGQVDHNISYPHGNRGTGGTQPVYDQWRIVFDHYEVDYRYRDGRPICEQWRENWTENCNLTFTPYVAPASRKIGERKVGEE